MVYHSMYLKEKIKMFGNKKAAGNSAIKNHMGSSSNSKAINTIVNSTSIEGNIKSENDIRIDGTLIGDLDCGSKVIIGPNGKVNGAINCINAVIEGKFEGNLNVQELLILGESAQVNANIKTEKCVVTSGAVFNGNCKMGNATSPTLTEKNTQTENHKIAKRKKSIAK